MAHNARKSRNCASPARLVSTGPGQCGVSASNVAPFRWWTATNNQYQRRFTSCRAYTNNTRVPSPFSSIIATTTTTVSSKLACYQHHITHSFFALAFALSSPLFLPSDAPSLDNSDTCAPTSHLSIEPHFEYCRRLTITIFDFSILDLPIPSIPPIEPSKICLQILILALIQPPPCTTTIESN